jgi:thioredoxin 1
MQDTNFSLTYPSPPAAEIVEAVRFPKQKDLQGPKCLPTLMYFYASGCAISKESMSFLVQIGDVYGESLKFSRVNIDANPSAALRYGVRSTPSFLLVEGNRVRWHRAGRINKQELLEQLLNLL